MWMPGALIGGILAYMIHPEAWTVGVIVGVVIGLLLGRVVRKPGGDRLAEVETRFGELHDRVDWLDRRVTTLEAVQDATAAAVNTPVVPPSPGPEPIEPLVAPAEAETAPAVEPAAPHDHDRGATRPTTVSRRTPRVQVTAPEP